LITACVNRSPRTTFSPSAISAGLASRKYQQSLISRRIAIVVLSATNWPIVKHHLEAIVEAIARATQGSFQEIECGRFTRKQTDPP
jgi:hypothetical protein